MANRAHAPTSETRKTVETLAAVGIPQKDIARLEGISVMTLRRHYRDELLNGGIKATAKVAESLFRQATGPRPNVAATIFWLKVRNRWRDDDKRFWIEIIEQLEAMMPKEKRADGSAALQAAG